MKILYPARIKKNSSDHRYLVQFPDLKEAITEGATMAEALTHAAEVLTLTLEGRMDEGMEIPLPSAMKNTYLIAPSARVQAALLVRLARGKRTITKLANDLETSWPAAARLEDPHHWPSLRQLEKALNSLGQRLVMSLEPSGVN